MTEPLPQQQLPVPVPVLVPVLVPFLVHVHVRVVLNGKHALGQIGASFHNSLPATPTAQHRPTTCRLTSEQGGKPLLTQAGLAKKFSGFFRMAIS